jgi:hypothetical protein
VVEIAEKVNALPREYEFEFEFAVVILLHDDVRVDFRLDDGESVSVFLALLMERVRRGRLLLLLVGREKVFGDVAVDVAVDVDVNISGAEEVCICSWAGDGSFLNGWL